MKVLNGRTYSYYSPKNTVQSRPKYATSYNSYYRTTYSYSYYSYNSYGYYSYKSYGYGSYSYNYRYGSYNTYYGKTTGKWRTTKNLCQHSYTSKYATGCVGKTYTSVYVSSSGGDAGIAGAIVGVCCLGICAGVAYCMCCRSK